MSQEITAEEAGEILGVTAGQVRWYYRHGLLPGRRLGRFMLLFRREDVETFEKPTKSGRPHGSTKERSEAKAKAAAKAKKRRDSRA